MKMTFAKICAVGLIVGVGSPASAASTIIGNGLAETCSITARLGNRDRSAENVCTQALEARDLIQRDQAATLVNRGIMRLRNGDYSLATADFNSAIQIVPGLGEAYVNRGAVLIKLGQYEASLVDLNKGIELGVEEPAKAYFNRALAYEGLDNLRAAYFDYRRASEINPEWQEPKTQLVRFT
ncbi:MAG: TPR domain-containing protein, partial [Hyphomonadaceae bacterium]